MRTGSDLIRARLSKAGIKWSNSPKDSDKSYSCATFIKGDYGNEVELYESTCGMFDIYNLTPNQAAKLAVMLK